MMGFSGPALERLASQMKPKIATVQSPVQSSGHQYQLIDYYQIRRLDGGYRWPIDSA